MKKPKKEEKPLSGAQDAYEWLQILIVALVTIILVFTFVGRITPVVGESMLPTLHEGDVMLIRDIGYTDPQPGDIVVLTKEFDAARGPIVKRIIAVEGQTVDIDYQTGTVYVDGEALDEPYLNEPMEEPWYEDLTSVTVPEGSVFVMGDNRASSADSRYHQDDGDHGLVPIDNVVGVGLMRYWPLNRMSFLSSHHDVFKDVPAGKAQ